MHPLRRKKGLRNALAFTGLLSTAAVAAAFFTQRRAEGNLVEKCSYVDPALIDVLAFAAAVFLVVEGLHQIVEHDHWSRTDRIGIAVRIAFGFAILTLHTMQVFYK